VNVLAVHPPKRVTSLLKAIIKNITAIVAAVKKSKTLLFIY
jgi:hypothetical protein